MRKFWLFLLVGAVLLGGCARSAPNLEAFLEACAKGDKPAVESMLQRNPGLAKDARPDGQTGLHEAIMASQDGLVLLLLDAGANPNQVKGNGNQPLHSAVHLLKPATISALIAKGAKTDGRAPNGDTPLIIAAAIGREDVCKVLLENKADVNAQNKENEVSALYHAASRSQVPLVKLLLEHKADPNRGIKTGHTPLMVAARLGNVDIVKLLLERKPNVNLVDAVGDSALSEAVTSGSLPLIDLLLKAGADPSVGITMQLARGKKDIQARLKKAGK